MVLVPARAGQGGSLCAGHLLFGEVHVYLCLLQDQMLQGAAPHDSSGLLFAAGSLEESVCTHLATSSVIILDGQPTAAQTAWPALQNNKEPHLLA